MKFKDYYKIMGVARDACRDRNSGQRYLLAADKKCFILPIITHMEIM
jgi:hypothetical protein